MILFALNKVTGAESLTFFTCIYKYSGLFEMLMRSNNPTL